MADIDKTAIIHRKAQLGKNVSIGPYSIIAEDVTIGDNCQILSHVVIDKWTTLGKNCTIHPFAAIGTAPQDLKYKGEKSSVEIGDNNTIRECVTVNRGTGEGEKTSIGNNCLIMAYSHIAHNCTVKDGVILANAGTLAGHVTLEDGVIIGGLSAIHQFCTIGTLSLIGGCSKVVQDIIPFAIADGHPAVPRTINLLGLKRRKFSPDSVSSLKSAFKILYKQGLNTSNALKKIEETVLKTPEIKYLVAFIKQSARGISK